MIDSPFKIALRKTLRFEGGYSNNPNDPGGETMYGITKKVAESKGYNGPMKDLPMNVVEQIYEENYWKPLRLESCNDQTICEMLFDIAVNMGVSAAGKMLQNSLNIIIGSNVIAVDGKIGPRTSEILSKLNSRQLSTLNSLLFGSRVRRYMEIIEGRPSSVIFLKGWLERSINSKNGG